MAALGLRSEPPLVVIVGPTASGKTALAVKLAKRHGGEIICADSRTVYKEMDIGTAKPTKAEQTEVPHWGLDLVAPGERFTAADFKQYAIEKIREIRSRGHIPFLVGGTGLYIDAVLFDYAFGGNATETQRQELEEMTIEDLQSYCIDNNMPLPENSTNKRYLVRVIERKGISGKRRKQPIEDTVIVGIATERDILRSRIAQRSEQLFADGVVEEATRLGNKYGWESEAMTGNIYPLVRRIVNHEITLDEAKQQFATLDWRLAKRQLTWLRRNSFIQWKSLPDAERYLEAVFASE